MIVPQGPDLADRFARAAVHVIDLALFLFAGRPLKRPR